MNIEYLKSQIRLFMKKDEDARQAVTQQHKQEIVRLVTDPVQEQKCIKAAQEGQSHCDIDLATADNGHHCMLWSNALVMTGLPDQNYAVQSYWKQRLILEDTVRCRLRIRW